MKNFFILIIIFLGISVVAFSQDKSGRELKGDKFFFNYSFDKAIKRYSKVKQLTSEGQHKLAESYYNLDMNVKAEEAYLNILNAQGTIAPEDYYSYAMILKMNRKYSESDQWMERFAKEKPNDLRAIDFKANRANLSNLQKDDGKYSVESLSINTKDLDFGPSYYKNQVVYASTRENPRMIVRKYNWTREAYWDIYTANKDGVQLKDPEPFDKAFNRKWHDGPVSFNKDGNFVAFTRNNYDRTAKDERVEIQIFFSSLNDEKWSDPEPFFLNSEAYSVGHPCLSADGNTMYFTSNMPGGFGGTDLYRSSKNAKGSWGPAENLGNTINTEGDEMFPFFEEISKTLFFSSNGRYGLGGLDIFRTTANESTFGPVYNAGAPLNTEYDDFSLIADDKMAGGYFSSDRPGGSGGDDIYYVRFLDNADVLFSVNSPENIPVERRVRETFPLRNYIFFNDRSTEIPDRYVLLNKDQVKGFKEDQLEVFEPKYLSGRSDRQMVVYYNVLNILGDRMSKNPSTSITLVGSSQQGPADGRVMAESVKKYLVDIFDIDASRIGIEGRDKPKLPSEQPGGIRELELLREGDQRVSIESSSPALLLEFQSGPDAPLKPVEIVRVEEAPLDSYVTFTTEGAEEVLTSWSLELKDEKGEVQNFGPYTQDIISVQGKTILGERTSGDYTATMVGQTKSGRTIRKDAPVHMVLWTPGKSEEMMRFSIIYEFDDHKAIQIYEKYLSNIIIPKIPEGGKVIIHGHTDVIGDADYNQKLSQARATDVRTILEIALKKAGRKDVTFEVFGFGEDLGFAAFSNSTPEERCYNRTVIIDIIPKH